MLANVFDLKLNLTAHVWIIIRTFLKCLTKADGRTTWWRRCHFLSGGPDTSSTSELRYKDSESSLKWEERLSLTPALRLNVVVLTRSAPTQPATHSPKHFNENLTSFQFHDLCHIGQSPGSDCSLNGNVCESEGFVPSVLISPTQPTWISSCDDSLTLVTISELYVTNTNVKRG